jgi:hypothetical protein
VCGGRSASATGATYDVPPGGSAASARNPLHRCHVRVQVRMLNGTVQRDHDVQFRHGLR